LVVDATDQQAAQVLAVERQDVEGIELRFVVCLFESSALKSAMPSKPITTASPSITNCLNRFFSAASTIHGWRFGPVVTAPCNQAHPVAVAPSRSR
jgi:hypothetical protein